MSRLWRHDVANLAAYAAARPEVCADEPPMAA
jgi:hypothetical protein